MRADIGSIQVQINQGVTSVLQTKIDEANQVVNNITVTIARGAEMQAAIIEEMRVQRDRIDQVITRANGSSVKAEAERHQRKDRTHRGDRRCGHRLRSDERKTQCKICLSH